MRRVSWKLANCHATVQKLLVRQVLNKSKLWSWKVKVGRCVIKMCTQPWRVRVALIVLYVLFIYDTYKTMKATRMHHGWVHMFTALRSTLSLQLHNFDLFRTCRIRVSALLRGNWQDFNWLNASHGPSAIAEFLVEFYTSCKISAMANASDFKFCTRVGHAKC